MSNFSYIDESYIKQLGVSLPRFKDVGNGTYNCRCVYCGDSSKSEYKARGYFYKSENGNWRYKCHNCSVNVTFSSFIEFYSPSVNSAYRVELKKEFREFYKNNKKILMRPKKNVDEVKTETVVDESLSAIILSKFEKISDLPEDHVAVKYLKSRSIPEDQMDKLYYIKDLSTAAKLIPSYKDRTVMAMSGIILPYFKNNVLESFQIRNLDEKSNLRYLTFDISESPSHIYNIENINSTDDVFVFEGAFDSMFCHNAVAASGASIIQKLNEIKSVNPNIAVVFDNDYKTNDVIEKLLFDIVEAGHSIVIFGDEMNGYKDINQFATKTNKTIDDVTEYLKSCVYSGRGARLKITSHKRTRGKLKWTSSVNAGDLKKKKSRSENKTITRNSVFTM